MERVDPSRVAFYRPDGLRPFKRNLFDRIGAHILSKGGAYVTGDVPLLKHKVGKGRVPIVGCQPETTALIAEWRAADLPWIYWDRGYLRRVFATDLPTGENGGYYRWHINGFQMQTVRDVPGDRWTGLTTPLRLWSKGGRHIVVAEPSETYQRFHRIEGWRQRTAEVLRSITDRPLVFRDKEMQRTGRKLHEDLKGAHCLVTHASNAATEAVIMGCPVFVDPSSAAALVGMTDLNEIERPIYPDREPWARSLSYSQFNERELVDGTLWKLMAG